MNETLKGDAGDGQFRRQKISSLIHDLSDKNEDIRWAAAYALTQIGAPAGEPLTGALDTRDSVVRLRAACALGMIDAGWYVD